MKTSQNCYNFGGQGTFKKVVRGVEILRSNNVEFNILMLVNDFNVNKAVEVYRFLECL